MYRLSLIVAGVCWLLATAVYALDQRLYVPGANDFGGSGTEQRLENNTGGTPPPPVGCSGAIDLTNGCPMPMLR